MKQDYLLYAVLLLSFLALGYGLMGFMPKSASSSGSVFEQESRTQIVKTKTGYTAVTTGSTEPGAAEITLTPKGMENGKFVIAFTANTHSVDLSAYDLTEITTLLYDGRQVHPLSASLMEGHHVSGVLTFDIAESPSVFTIEIIGIPNIEKRVFAWGGLS